MMLRLLSSQEIEPTGQTYYTHKSVKRFSVCCSGEKICDKDILCLDFHKYLFLHYYFKISVIAWLGMACLYKMIAYSTFIISHRINIISCIQKKYISLQYKIKLLDDVTAILNLNSRALELILCWLTLVRPKLCYGLTL